MLLMSPRKDQEFPELVTALVVCRVSLYKHNVEVLPHVVTLVDEYLNPFSSRKKVGRACRLGFPRRALEYAAARDPDWSNGQYMAAAAVIRGFVHVLEWLNECYPERTSWGDGHEGNALRSAAKYGHVEVVLWLSEIVRKEPRGDACIQDAVRIAFEAGHVEAAEQLNKQTWFPNEIQLI
ncbi:hypothetical protein PF008_g16877 [Phytophthora fragariae]|uniref:Ankyrin repeat protein n=1 Tax=Phytophthora fragariae TaxID=53985 RepID=A0A6G0RAS7_9STRA|nr:hypothetical protein PF003_g14324 [Phytophthora fragariae]KAE9325455.1 hypothetical protein PF008_g16877 [Phytophthora fragariae]